MGAEETASLRHWPMQRSPLVVGDQQLGARYLADAADVVLVEMADDRMGDVGGAVTQALEAGGERLVLADVETREAAIDHAVRALGKVRRISYRRSVLPR